MFLPADDKQSEFQDRPENRLELDDSAFPAWSTASGGAHGGTPLQPVVVRNATPQEISGWDELVTRFENHRIFQKLSWLRSIEDFSGAKLLCLIFEKEGDVVGCLPGFLVKKALLRIFGSPLPGWQTETMGPAYDPQRISTREIFNNLIPFLATQYRVQHLELASAQLNPETANELGVRCTPQFTYRVPLFPHDQERTLKNIKPKTRNQLRKAVKLGLVATVEVKERFVDEFYDQVSEVFLRRGKSLPFNRNRVVQCFRHMRETGNLLAISVRLGDTGPSIATGIFVFEGPELHLWGWAHRTQYRWYCPTELLTWTAMQKGMAVGCVTLDMAGGGEAKEKFGAVPDKTVYRFLWSRYKGLEKLRQSAEKTYRWHQRFRGRLAQKRTKGGKVFQQT